MMPQMPNLPSLNNESSESEVGASSSPFTEDSAELKTAESNVTEEEVVITKPVVVTPSEPSNHVKLQVPKKGIEVVATRKGFYNQNRLRDGDSFHIKSTQDFGDWFRCVDPMFEKERVKFLQEARKKK